MTERNQAPLNEGVGLRLPLERHPGHEHIQWYELDLDDAYDDPDTEPVEILTTARHREVPS
jgi:hypothetical protein